MTAVNDAAPLVIDFVDGAVLEREADRPSDLPIVRNGTPGTFVRFDALRTRVSLPTDQITFAHDSGRGVTVGFGGMTFFRMEGGELVFLRTRELLPEAQLSPTRSHRMRLQPAWVESIAVLGRTVWPER